MQKTLLWSPFITETRRKIVFPTRCLRIFAQMLMCEELFFPWVKYWGRLSRGKILKPWVGEELRKVGWGEVELEQRVVLWFGTNQSNQTDTLPGFFFILQNFYDLRRISIVFFCSLVQFFVCAWGVDWIYSVSCVDWFWLSWIWKKQHSVLSTALG